jgi:hypothetical protein
MQFVMGRRHAAVDAASEQVITSLVADVRQLLQSARQLLLRQVVEARRCQLWALGLRQSLLLGDEWGRGLPAGATDVVEACEDRETGVGMHLVQRRPSSRVIL